MINKLLRPALLALAIAPLATASAVEQLNNCKLRGGSMVQLAADACLMEGGAVTAATPSMPVVSDESLHLSSDTQLADAQRVAAKLLIKPVLDMNMKKRLPEGVERSVRFDGCRMQVEESVHVDHGNVISARMNFKVSSSVDLAAIAADSYGVLGKVTSYGGGIQTFAVYVEEKKLKEGNHLAIAMLEQKESGARNYALNSAGAYWDASKDDYWMADGYGYPKGLSMDEADTSKIRVLYFLNSAAEAVALKQALDDVRAMCAR